MTTDMMTASRSDTAIAGGLTQLTDDEIAAVGGGVGPLFGLAVFVGILILAGTCGRCN